MAIGIEKRAYWLDITLAFIEGNDRRIKRLSRLWKQLEIGHLFQAGDAWNMLEHFARGIVHWSETSAIAREYIASDIRQTLAESRFAQDTNSQRALLTLNLWSDISRPTVTFTLVDGEIQPRIGKGIHTCTTEDFISFLQSPRPVRCCLYCGAPYLARSNATYCSTGCRTLAARLREAA